MRLEAWRDRFIVDDAATCWDRAVLRSEFRYEYRYSSYYWMTQLCWERRTLSSLGRLVQYHLLTAYNLTETARDRLLVRIPASYEALWVFHGKKLEQEPVFSYKRHALRDEQSGLWVLAYTECVVRVCAALLIAAHEEYRLWYVTPNVIAFARRLCMDMAVVLGSRGNECELLEMLSIIESTQFETLPNAWRDSTTRSVDYHTCRTGPGGDFLYYDPWLRRKVDKPTAMSHAAATRVVPDDVQLGWVHVEDDTIRAPRDTTRDFIPTPPYEPEVMPAANPMMRSVRDDRDTQLGAGPYRDPLPTKSQAVQENNDSASSQDAVIIRRFLGVLASADNSMSVAELRGYIRGRVTR